jgi:hypothetical protein
MEKLLNRIVRGRRSGVRSSLAENNQFLSNERRTIKLLTNEPSTNELIFLQSFVLANIRRIDFCQHIVSFHTFLAV